MSLSEAGGSVDIIVTTFTIACLVFTQPFTQYFIPTQLSIRAPWLRRNCSREPEGLDRGVWRCRTRNWQVGCNKAHLQGVFLFVWCLIKPSVEAWWFGLKLITTLLCDNFQDIIMNIRALVLVVGNSEWLRQRVHFWHKSARLFSDSYSIKFVFQNSILDRMSICSRHNLGEFHIFFYVWEGILFEIVPFLKLLWCLEMSLKYLVWFISILRW